MVSLLTRSSSATSPTVRRSGRLSIEICLTFLVGGGLAVVVGLCAIGLTCVAVCWSIGWLLLYQTNV